MAIPREPRQKMINMMYLVLTALLALNVSSEILNAFKTVNHSLEQSVITVNQSTSNVIKSLEEKTVDPTTAEKAKVWYPKAQQVAAQTKELNDYIAGLKTKILQAAGQKEPNGSYKEDNLDVATRIMVEQNEGKTLLAKLEAYKKNILLIDPKIDSAFKTSLPIDTKMPPTKSKHNTWESAYFRMVPTVAALTILSKFQNDVKTAENKLVTFCHEQVGKVEIRFDEYAAIIGQSSSYLMPGQELEIKAGVGAFSKQALPTITIGGRTVQVNDSGYARVSQVVTNLGQGSIPITIEYTDQDGKKQSIRQQVTYTVGAANASIALDKMNVLYIGVDNPVTISASGAGDDRTQASIVGAGGSLTKIGPGKYIARVNSVSDDCRISVSVNGKLMGASTFRTRTIPKPQALVGNFESGTAVPANQFRAQAGVAAGILNFPFELKFKVTSFTITADTEDGYLEDAQVQGNLWNGEARRILNNLKNGRTVTIDDIYAVGDDNRRQKLPSLVYYIK